MKKLFILLIILTYALAYPQDKYDVNFKNISMKEFVTFVSSFTGTNIVYNEGDLRGQISVTSQKPMKAAEIMQIFTAALQSNGLNAVKEGNYIKIVPDKDMAQYDEKFYEGKKVSPESFVTTVVMLNNYNAVALSNSLSRIKSKYGNVEPLRGLNGIIIKDFGSRIEKMREICAYMDKNASGFQLYSVTLQNINASKMEQQISRLFNELLKNSLTGHVPMMVSDDVSNVLVFVTDENGYNKIEYLIRQIDIKNTKTSSLPKVYYLKYAKAEDVEKVLNKHLSSSTAGNVSQNATTSLNKSVSFDKSTNSIIAIGDQELYSNLEIMIEKLDIPRKQVYVEALILETSMDRGDSFGVEWFGSGTAGNGFGFGNLGGNGNIGSILSNQGTNHPISNLPGGFSAGLIGNVITFNGIKFPSLGAFMNAVRTDSGVNIVSNPQILTLDNEEAEVFVGENRPYVTSEKFDSNNNPIQTFDYKDVGIRLKVIPHIAGDDTVQLEINQEVNKISPATFNETAPVTLTRTTKTKVQLYDRSIMMISGLMKDDSSVVTTGIPFLSRIPILGWLFKSEKTTQEKTNLMVFITTHVIHAQEDMDEIVYKRYMGSYEFNKDIEDITNTDEQSFVPMHKHIKEAYTE